LNPSDGKDDDGHEDETGADHETRRLVAGSDMYPNPALCCSAVVSLAGAVSLWGSVGRVLWGGYENQKVGLNA
jgi:hypothetical protein